MPRNPRKPEPRPDADILDDAIGVIAPYNQRDVRARITRFVEGLRRLGQAPKASAETKNRLRKRLERMQAVRNDLVEMGSPEAMKTLLSLYDEQIRVVETKIRFVRPGGPEPNISACCAVAYARDLLQSSGQRVRWAQWHRLASLIYEGATGEYDANLSKYLSRHQRGLITAPAPGIYQITDAKARRLK
jgi:hypothetical protein